MGQLIAEILKQIPFINLFHLQVTKETFSDLARSGLIRGTYHTTTDPSCITIEHSSHAFL